MILKLSYYISLSLALTSPMRTSAGYNCGEDYLDAISNCDLPCPSMLGYTAGADVNECPEHKPYCYKTTICADVASSEEEAVAEKKINTTDAVTDEPEMLYMNLAMASIELEDEPEILEYFEEDAPPEVESDSNVTEMVANSEQAELPPTISPAPTTEYDKRRSMPNPGNHFCAIGWNEATIECENNVDAIPCPPGENGALMSCPTGTFCYGITDCVRPTPSTNVPTQTPTTYAPTTESPSSSPISADDPVNFYFCGSDLVDANENCGTWCRYGTDEECPEGQICHLQSTCNATALNITIDWDVLAVTELPSTAPTYAPTVDDNPESLYCGEAWHPSTYDGPCGIPCPK